MLDWIWLTAAVEVCKCEIIDVNNDVTLLLLLTFQISHNSILICLDSDCFYFMNKWDELILQTVSLHLFRVYWQYLHFTSTGYFVVNVDDLVCTLPPIFTQEKPRFIYTHTIDILWCLACS